MSYDEIPHTYEGLMFYVDRAGKTIKDYQLKIKRLEENMAQANVRLQAIYDSPKKEEML